MDILKKIGLIITCFIIVACNNKQPRRPVSVKTGSVFLKESAKKNRELLKWEEALIDSIIKKDTSHTYISSQHGFKFYYTKQNLNSDYTAKFGDKVTYNYSISDIKGNEIYANKNSDYQYYVDKEELFLGLRSALKILKEDERGVFFFPSEIAYGYRGDKDKIENNQPIIVDIQVMKIEKDTTNFQP